MECKQNTMHMMQDMALAMAYVPWQKWGGIYEPCKAFTTGTLFAMLDKPFKGGCR